MIRRQAGDARRNWEIVIGQRGRRTGWLDCHEVTWQRRSLARRRRRSIYRAIARRLTSSSSCVVVVIGAGVVVVPAPRCPRPPPPEINYRLSLAGERYRTAVTE